MDHATGEILFESNLHMSLPPASMTKMMTALIAMEEIETGNMELQRPVKVSAKASLIGGSQVYLKHGEDFTLEELMRALMIHSANDAAVAIAETVAGSTEAFVDLMNMRASELGMIDSTFHSVHGLPPGKGQKMDATSAYDMAILARHLIRYPKVLEWTSIMTAPFRGGKFTLYNTNKLIGRYQGLDGIKTGYIKESGYCVTATALRRSRRMISVVMGAPSEKAKQTETTRLLTMGFHMYRTLTLADASQVIEGGLSVEDGKVDRIAVAYAEPLSIEVRKDRASEVELVNDLPEEIEAPVTSGQVVGKGIARLDGQTLAETPIIALESVEEASLWEKIIPW
ncbi:D-alanyl-D-alanine carboxypeptidase family protein [Thermodesulfobacteriota bacterium]